LTESVTLTDNTLNVTGTQQSIGVSGTGILNPELATLTSPAPGSTFAEPEVTFTWTPVAGVTQYGLWVGTAGAGSNNLYDSGPTTATSVTTRSMPTNAGRVYARLWSNFNGVWAHVDYTFTAK
jgi:hypothetical protein